MTAGTLTAPSLDTPVETDVPQSVADTKTRLALLDTVRLLAAVGIVWIHAAQSATGKLLYPIGTFGVPFYTFVAVLFSMRTMTREPRRSFGSYLATRLFRVYLPFLAWTVIYTLLGEAKSFEQHHALAPVSLEIFYSGGEEHLWFLPYLMVVTTIAVLFVHGFERRPLERKFVIASLGVLGLLASFTPEPQWVAMCGEDLFFWRYTIRAIPSACWALAFGLATVSRGQLPRSSRRIAFTGLLLWVAALLLEAFFAPLKPYRAIAGLGITLFALLPFAPTWAMRIGRYGRYSYGIYLSHVVFLRLIGLAADHFGVTPTLGTDVASFAIAFAGALALSIAFSQSKWTRWTLGE